MARPATCIALERSVSLCGQAHSQVWYGEDVVWRGVLCNVIGCMKLRVQQLASASSPLLVDEAPLT